MKLQTAVNAVFPPECISCGALVETEFGLCGPCWSETGFISGAACDACGTPLPGVDAEPGLRCDDCMIIARPWTHGRAAVTYSGNGRKMVLALKHGDRAEIARASGRWLVRAAGDLLQNNTLVIPIPLHWFRLFRRRANQSALLAQAMVRCSGKGEVLPDGLIRNRATASQDGNTREERFENLRTAIRPNERHRARMAGGHVLLIDDVMTSGATFSAATEACFSAGAQTVNVLALARVAKDA